MKNHGKTLLDRMYDSVRKGIYTAAAIGLGYMGMNYLAPSKAYAQVRVEENENFNGSITKSNIRNPTDKWILNVDDTELKCKDYDSGGAGYEFFYFNDKLYEFTPSTKMCVEVETRKNVGGNNGLSKEGIIIAGSPTDNTYYLFAINTHPEYGGQWWIYRNTPGIETHRFLGGFSDLITKGGTNRLIASYDANGYNIKIGAGIDELLTPDEKRILNERLPLLSGYTGLIVEDTNDGIDDPSIITSFDNHKTTYTPQGGGQALAGGGVVKDPSIPHVPELFIRGDANRDFKLGVADAVVMLRYLFLDDNEFKCYDAMDMEDDGSIDITDPLKLLFKLFGGVDYQIPPPSIGGYGLDLDITEKENGQIVGIETLNCDDGLSPSLEEALNR